MLTWAIFWFVIAQLSIAATARESFFTTGLAFDINAGVEQVYGAEWLLQLGFVMMLPLFLARWNERGIRAALIELVEHMLSLKVCFGLFSMRTAMNYFDRGLRLGEAEYVATGRNYNTMTSNYAMLFSLYARSHFCFAVEVLILCMLYLLFTTQPSYFGLYTWPVLLWIGSVLYSPWLFNPQAFISIAVRENLYEFLMWLDDRSGVNAGFGSWTAWHRNNMKGIRKRSALSRFLLFASRDAFPRLVVFTLCCAALDVSEFAPPGLRRSLMDAAASGSTSASGSSADEEEVVDEGPRGAVAPPHLRSWLLLQSAGFFVCIGLLHYAACDRRYVRRSLLPHSLWWHLIYCWIVRVSLVAAYIALCMFWHTDLGPARLTTKNGAIFFATGVIFQTIIAQALALRREPSTSREHVAVGVLRYSDFWFREVSLQGGGDSNTPLLRAAS